MPSTFMKCEEGRTELDIATSGMAESDIVGGGWSTAGITIHIVMVRKRRLKERG